MKNTSSLETAKEDISENITENLINSNNKENSCTSTLEKTDDCDTIFENGKSGASEEYKLIIESLKQVNSQII